MQQLCASGFVLPLRMNGWASFGSKWRHTEGAVSHAVYFLRNNSWLSWPSQLVMVIVTTLNCYLFENQTCIVGNVKFLCMVQNSKYQACIISWSLVTFLWPNISTNCKYALLVVVQQCIHSLKFWTPNMHHRWKCLWPTNSKYQTCVMTEVLKYQVCIIGGINVTIFQWHICI